MHWMPMLASALPQEPLSIAALHSRNTDWQDVSLLASSFLSVYFLAESFLAASFLAESFLFATVTEGMAN